MFENVRADIRLGLPPRMQRSPVRALGYLMTSPECLAVLVFRFGHWVSCELRFKLVRILLQVPYFFLRRISTVFFGAEIWPESQIGPGFRIEHSGCIHVMATIGRNCRISQQVTIGHIGGFKGGGTPVLGDDVYVGAGAKILGDVRIGSGAKIGANAVVITDVPDDALAVGVPARIKTPKLRNHRDSFSEDGAGGNP